MENMIRVMEEIKIKVWYEMPCVIIHLCLQAYCKMHILLLRADVRS